MIIKDITVTPMIRDKNTNNKFVTRNDYDKIIKKKERKNKIKKINKNEKNN